MSEVYQDRVAQWLLTCFGDKIATSKLERAFRFFEEAAELAQSLGMTQEQCQDLLDYTFARPFREPEKEVGGVLVTLASLCWATGVDMSAAGEIELQTVWKEIDNIKAKHTAKQHRIGSSLPGFDRE